MTNITCQQCGLANTPIAVDCSRCGALLRNDGNEAFAAPYAASPSGHQYSNAAQFTTINAGTPWYGQDISIPLEGLEGHDIVLRTRLLSNSKLLMDGAPMAKKRGRVQLPANDGSLVDLRLKSRFLDPVPNIEVYGRTIVLLAALDPLEYLWIGIPLVLVFFGGAIGGGFGFIAMSINVQIFRTRLSAPIKFVVTGVITGSAFVGVICIAVLLSLVLNGPPAASP